MLAQQLASNDNINSHVRWEGEMKKAILLITVLKESVVFAQESQGFSYVQFDDNIESSEGSKMSNSEYQKISKEALYNNVDNKQSTHQYGYKDNENYAVKSHKRLSDTRINNHERLYTGEGIVEVGRGAIKSRLSTFLVSCMIAVSL